MAEYSGAFKALARLILTALLLYAVYIEAGPFTSLSLLLIYIGYEFMGWQLLKLSSAIIGFVDRLQEEGANAKE